MSQKLEITQVCINTQCSAKYPLLQMLFTCKTCGSPLEYDFDGEYSGIPNDRTDQWRNFELMPLNSMDNIHSLNEGNSQIVHLKELSSLVDGAEIYLMCDAQKNPTGTFKDREASIILSRCKEIGLDNLVFYSTANTGRSYTHYASSLGLTSFMFMPSQCSYKNTVFVKKNKNNFIIYVDAHYPEISPFTKLFAKNNNLTPIAPMHDRTESYATLAYEQFQHLPKCDYFVQTIASGMGPIGFYKGHKNLVKLGVQKVENIPRILCIQISQMNVMARAYNEGRDKLYDIDMPSVFPDNLFEPTLNSTNPVNNYPQLKQCLDENHGIITDVTPDFTTCQSQLLESVLKERGIFLRSDIEKSLLIEFAGVVKLAQEKKFKKGQVILMLACGRGKDNTESMIEPDETINIQNQDPRELYEKLMNKL